MCSEGIHESIDERQNSTESLDKLAAQRLLYRKVNKVELARLGLLFSVVVVLFAGLAFGPATMGEHVGLGGALAVVLFWIVDQLCLVPLAQRIKEEAATIQQDFDCDVLDIPWSEHLGIPQPIHDRTKRLAVEASSKGVRQCELEDWYSLQKNPVNPVAEVLHCQRQNCDWDANLRREWICCVRIVFGVIAIPIVVLAALTDIRFAELVLCIAAGIRLFAWQWNEQTAHRFALKRIEALHRYLSVPDDEICKLTSCDVRLVQTSIFEHRRTCPTIPDFYYKLRKKPFERRTRS